MFKNVTWWVITITASVTGETWGYTRNIWFTILAFAITFTICEIVNISLKIKNGEFDE